jgi:hypothetical protein
VSKECENFIRFGLKVHLYKGCDVCDGNPLHCAAYSCACPCDNAHDKHDCTACANFSQLPFLAKALFNGARNALLQRGCLDVDSDEDKALQSMAMSAAHIAQVLFAYHAHMARGLWQNKAISLLESTITTTHCLISLDHKMKTIPRARDESAAAWFGKSGMVLLGFCVLYRDDQGDVIVSYLDVVFESRTQDAAQTSKGLECIIQLVHERRPGITHVTFVSDNGPAISASENIHYVASRNVDRWGADVFVAKWVYHEPGHGKTHLDSHFSFVTILFSRFVLDKGALSSPRDMFEALKDRGGICNSSAALVDDKEDATAAKAPKTPTPGVQKAREIIFGEDDTVSMRAFSARPGFMRTHKYTTKASTKQFVVSGKFFGEHKARDGRSDTKEHRSHEPAITGDVSRAPPLMKLIAECLLDYAHQSTLGAPLTTFSLPDTFAQADEVRTACRQRYLTAGWANEVKNPTIPLPPGLVAIVEKMYNDGNTSTIKYSPAAASQVLCFHPQVSNNFLYRMALSEAAIRAIFNRLGQQKKQKANAAAAPAAAPASVAPAAAAASASPDVEMATEDAEDAQDAADDEVEEPEPEPEPEPEDDSGRRRARVDYAALAAGR